MNKIITIGTPDFVMGFRSAGIQGYIVKNSKEAKIKLRDFCNRNDIAIIFIGETVAKDIIEFIDELNVEKTLPSIMVLEDEKTNENISGIALKKSIQRAVGIDLDKK